MCVCSCIVVRDVRDVFAQRLFDREGEGRFACEGSVQGSVRRDGRYVAVGRVGMNRRGTCTYSRFIRILVPETRVDRRRRRDASCAETI